MKLKITTNFDFSKLSNKMNGLIKEYMNGYTEQVEKGTKQNINRSVYADGDPLTLDEKSYRAGQKPLVRTGKFLDSIKAKGGKLTMLKYGKKHNFGEWDHLLKGTYTANFIGTTDKNKQRIDKKFLNNINKALKK